MRRVLLIAAIVAAFAVNPAASQTILSNTSALVLEATPFVLCGSLVSRYAARWRWLLPYLSCGCGGEAAARSLPAAALTWFLFGPIAALCRVAAASLCAYRCRSACSHITATQMSVLHELAALAIAGAVASATTTLLPIERVAQFGGVSGSFAAGAILGVLCSPCALGAVAFASALRMHAPAAAAGFLCTAGIVGLRARLRTPAATDAHDLTAYVLLSGCCLFVAMHRCAGFLNPFFTVPLWIAAVGFAALAHIHRNSSAQRLRVVGCVVLAGIIGAPGPPQYHATETSLADIFAGERIDFTGSVVRTGPATTVVRYAITCCRADAMPVVLKLDRFIGIDGWVRVRGVLRQSASGLALHPESVQAIAPPADPFVYR